MPKIFVLRHKLAEQTRSIEGLSLSKENFSSYHNDTENLLERSSDWACHSWRDQGGDEPLELVTRKPEPVVEPKIPEPAPLNAQATSTLTASSPPRTLAARKAYYEPFNDSPTQEKVTGSAVEDIFKKTSNRFIGGQENRYHPYMRPSESEEQETPMNLEVPKKPWYNTAERQEITSDFESTGQSVEGCLNLPSPLPDDVVAVHHEPPPVQEEPVDFSKKAKKEPKDQNSHISAKNREVQFQRNLLVILLQSINRNPSKGKHLVRFLKTSCDKYTKHKGCSGGKGGTGGTPKQSAQGSSGGVGGGFSGISPGGGSTGGSLHSSRSNSTDQEDDTFDSTETDFDSIDFDFNESATRKWIVDNPDLAPLKVLDHINFKNEIADSPQSEVQKPPDLNTLDRDTATFLQLAVPVPDPSATFMDIGTDFGPVSLYEDDPFNLEQLIPSTFNMNASTSSQRIELQQHQQQQQLVYPTMQQQVQQQQQMHIPHTSISHQLPVRQMPVQQQPQKSPLDLPSHLAFQTFLPEVTVLPIRHQQHQQQQQDPQQQQKQQQQIQLQQQPQHHQQLQPQLQSQQHQLPISVKSEHMPLKQLYPQIKEEVTPHLAEPKVDTDIISQMFATSQPDMSDFGVPQSSSSSNNNNNNNNSEAKSPKRKKSSEITSEEEDLLNVPSLQMRIQILQQRYGIPQDAPLELINGGHGIKNPNVADVPEKKEIDKLPPLRCENDPSRFACRMCGKSFGLQRLLNRHMKCHSDTKRYLCTFCGKGFNDTFDLKRHTRTHTGVRPYKCNLCEKSFTQRCSLESHCLKVHGVTHQYEYKQRRSKVYVCEDCGHTTKEPEVHYLHLKEQHPYSPALLKFYDKRHFKFNNSQFSSNEWQ